ncbi:MAG: efflux RND transporter periplasmic adaptor subunit [Planctomycetota bacterium]|jgi:multidrug efflux pump subunit AcrA (membrane-fusion protein)
MTDRWKKAGLAGSFLLLGLIAGLTVRADGLFRIVRDGVWLALGVTEPQDADDHAHDHDDGEDGGEHLDLTDVELRAIGLRTKRVAPADFVRTVSVPGMVIEKPGHSGRTISSKVHGIIREVFCAQGQLVRPGDPLFDLELTGDAFATSQSALLETLLQIETTGKELARISDLAKQNLVPGRQKIELEYELSQLQKKRDLRRQELLVRGLTNTQIDTIVDTGVLLDRIMVRVPARQVAPPAVIQPTAAIAVDEPGLLSESATSGNTSINDARLDVYTVETIDVHPGASVSPGQQLGHLAWHDVLYVEGYAFERDLDMLATLHERDGEVSIEFGSHDEEVRLGGLALRFLDNHVDPDTGTFRFYLELANEVLIDSRDEQGLQYRSWRFKPGQRLHIRVPVETYSQQFVLPEEAIFEDSLLAFVFRRTRVIEEHAHDHGPDEAHEHGHDHDDDHEFVYEFEKVPVRILHRDRSQVVVAANGELKADDRIAWNSAYQLHLTMQSGSGGGHSHDHGHEH